MNYYPVFLDLRGRRVLVVGAGKVALRKTRGLVEAGARVTVVAPEFLPEFEGLPIETVSREFAPRDVAGMFLVFTATDNRAVNAAASAEAKRLGIPVNVADARAECDFVVPARVRRGPVHIAISTGGTNPRLAAAVRRRIEEMLPE